MSSAREASEAPSELFPNSTSNYRILTISKLKELQNEDNKNRISISKSIWKYYMNDLYTDFEKKILECKPSDCSIIEKFSKIETFPISNNKNINKITLSTIQSDHPLREFHKRSLIKNANDIKNLDKVKDQINKIDTLPVIVFINGLGGQLSQFEPILQEFRNCSDIYGIELPGFGNSKRPSRNKPEIGLLFSRLSKFNDEDLINLENSLNELTNEEFKTDIIVDILKQILIYKFPNRRFIIIGHSMGSHISMKLINQLPIGKVDSFIMMSPPKINLIDNGDKDLILNKLNFTKRSFLRTCWYFPRLFDYYRFFDRYGGLYSHSVDNYIFSEKNEKFTDEDILKRLTQFRWNLDTETIIFLKYLNGFKCITKDEMIESIKRLNTKKLLLCCGEFDNVTNLKDSIEINNIIKDLNEINCQFEIIPNSNHSIFLDKPNLLAGIIYKFIEELGLNISCTWVLQIKALISGDKWGLKNEVKWNKVITISKPILNPFSKDKPKSYLLGMKTLRQNDKFHNPIQFENDHPEIFGIIDIGSDTPSYDPKDFKKIKYVKFKTESKVTPDNLTIAKFIEIVDKLIKERDSKEKYVVIHCHYGQNRTGFLICCYLIEKLGWSVSEAIKGFEISKEPGIKHVHFKNELYLRYGE
ncbi:hypothetical protein C6P40_000959 [Pichia californica]|uniref:Tyrosine specific protein phosphatases domain-containing protein n=1 Tax=Pichia californica TaxID=460514 RepID=A0A9P7BHS3_9ASCO|nr:hypothetical protein C6P42_002330 [[Candida] californica]KAG0690875.1 hypothetical protein C6P40_000959 [[Candida] californica]